MNNILYVLTGNKRGSSDYYDFDNPSAEYKVGCPHEYQFPNGEGECAFESASDDYYGK